MPVLTATRDGAILRLTLNRPDVRNAFDEEVIAALTRTARETAADPTIRAVVLNGAGPVFCAGADLGWMTKAIAYTQEENLRDAEDLARMLELLDSMPVPLIARVQGAALGGGVGLVAVCDIVVAADDAVFGFSEVKLGILPAVISPYVLAKTGAAAARELFLTGMRFGAARAREIGLVHAVVPEAGLDAAIDGYLAEILTSGPGAIAAAKSLIREIHGVSPANVIGVTTSRIARQRVSPEGQEGMRAFLEKRRPSWTSRS
jgi:methylglutaconyl-CoA hydratase